MMRETLLQNTFICQPQSRNVHGRVFGGFLMRCVGEWLPVLPTGGRVCGPLCVPGQSAPVPDVGCLPLACRRAYEVAHANTYLFAGCRPLAGQSKLLPAPGIPAPRCGPPSIERCFCFPLYTTMSNLTLHPHTHHRPPTTHAIAVS